MLELNTFSIVGRCARTGKLGVAVATAVPGVGSNCPYAAAGIGAIATQAWVNPYLGIDGLQFLADGLDAHTTLDRLLAADPGRDLRQVGIVDRDGNSAAHSGVDCTGWYGHRTGAGYAVQGNMLVDTATITAMAQTWEATEEVDLSERLMRSLEAGQAMGGDRRGKQSAALLVVKTEAYAYVNLRVDEHHDPVTELRRVLTVASAQLLPFVDMMPTRVDPYGTMRADVITMLGKAPAERT